MMIRPGLETLAAVLLLAGTTATAEAQPSASPRQTFVIVHGAWDGGWAFRQVEQRLRERGHAVYRPTLTGQGERVHLASPEIGLETHIQDVVNLIEFEDISDIVLVGHSYGGMVITGVADRLASRVRRLVYVDAFVPGDGDSVMSLLGERGAWLKGMERSGFIVPPWVKNGQPRPHDVPHSVRTFTDPLRLTNEAAQRIPAIYILTVDKGKTEDDFSPQAERARARGWTVEQMEADHNPQWTDPEALVERLEGAGCGCGP